MPTDLATNEPAATAATSVRRLQRLADLLDSRFRVPGTGWRVGLDGIVGLIPGVGDTATGLLSSYIVLEAWRLGVRKRTLSKMIWNVGVDFLVGSVPLFGDLFDIAWKSNTKNIKLILKDVSTAKQ